MNTLAMVIGNNEYPEERTKLKNAVNDAKAIEDVFKRLEYDVISGFDVDTENVCNLLEEFSSRIHHYDASIFYFAGHGFQIKGENYLATTDCPIENGNEYMCGKHSIKLTEITDIIKSSTTSINIIIIDACRISIGRGISSHFTNVNAPEGTIIAFSTSPGESASDSGADGHSIYTGTLLKYIGRENLSVEELFKKVRKTIFNLTKGMQTSWEHTSLVGDFYFNTGQMLHSVSIPYDDSVVKDRTYQHKGTPIDNIIRNLQSCNWDKQNPAIAQFMKINPNTMDKNELFIIGRNLYQSSGYAHIATDFFENLDSHLQKYIDTAGDNHLLNGILFEIYFNHNGEFRHNNIKKNMISNVFSLRFNPYYKKSFEFIKHVLEPHQDELFFTPEDGKEQMIDVDIIAETKEKEKFLSTETEQVEYIQSIIINGREIIEDFSKYCKLGINEKGLINILADYLAAPEELININSNIKIKKLEFDVPDEFEGLF